MKNLEMAQNILISKLRFQVAVMLLGIPSIGNWEQNWEQIGNRIPQNTIEQHVP
jgi:hypothetical protein